MQRIEAEFEIVTPMFLGGADPATTVELRASSIKGALRFWWRALHYSRMVVAEGGDQAKALKKLRERESYLFGSADDKVGQGCMLLSLVTRSTDLERLSSGAVLTDQSNRRAGPGARYLGYGLLQAFGVNAGQLNRPCIMHKTSFVAHILFRPATSLDDHSEIISTLKLFGLVGGLGSRVRRGFGSVSLKGITRIGTEPHIVAIPARTREDFISELRMLLQPALVGYASAFQLTAFGAGCRIDVTNWQVADPLVALDRIGRGMQRYRSWGHRGEVNHQPSEKRFEDDHDWFRRQGRFQTSRGSFVPNRTAFGLPHNYGPRFGVSGPDKTDRRGSPLHCHIHKTSNGQSFGVMAILPNRFLPEEKVSIIDGSYRNARDYIFDSSVLTDFLDGAGTLGRTGLERFVDGETIVPAT